VFPSGGNESPLGQSENTSVNCCLLRLDPKYYHSTLGWGYADSIFQIFRDYEIVPRIAQEATGALAVVTLVAGGYGVALVPASLSNLRLPGLSYRPIKGRCRTSDLTLVWQRDSRASTVRAFLEVVKREYLGARKKRNGVTACLWALLLDSCLNFLVPNLLGRGLDWFCVEL
jgi:DNA-binding transcriptional LysR family regulator